MVDLRKLVTEAVAEDNLSTSPGLLATEIIEKLTDIERRELLQEVVTRSVKRVVSAKTRPGVARPTPGRVIAAQGQRDLGNRIAQQQGDRMFFLLSLNNGQGGHQRYKDMTQANWQEFVMSRERISRVAGQLAQWGKQNLQALAEHGKSVSGELPENVQASLLRRMPQASGREIEQSPVAVTAGEGNGES